MTRVILVRHGETVWNADMKYQGHSDTLLSENGLLQAEAVAERLADEQIAAVYSSDLSRAFVTAEHIARRHNLQVSTIDSLREIKFGEWEGLTNEQVGQKWPGFMANLLKNTDQVTIPGGESFMEVKARASAAIDQLVSKHHDQTIVVVSHGGTIRTIICSVLNVHLNYVWNIKLDNTAVNIVDYYHDRRPILVLLNDAHHLT